jgi:hypothetical protein
MNSGPVRGLANDVAIRLILVRYGRTGTQVAAWDMYDNYNETTRAVWKWMDPSRRWTKKMRVLNTEVVGEGAPVNARLKRAAAAVPDLI